MSALIDDNIPGMEEPLGLSRKGHRDQIGKLLVPLVMGHDVIWTSICHPWAETIKALTTLSLRPWFCLFLLLKFFFWVDNCFPNFWCSTSA